MNTSVTSEEHKNIFSCSFCKKQIQKTSYGELCYIDKTIKYCCERDCKGSQVLSILESLHKNNKNKIKKKELKIKENYYKKGLQAFYRDYDYARRIKKGKRTLLATIKKGNSNRRIKRYVEKNTIKFFDGNDNFIKIIDSLFKVNFLNETESLNYLLENNLMNNIKNTI